MSGGGIDPTQLRERVVEPVLHKLDLYSEAAATLLMMTAAHESRLGRYIVQVRGPALGVWQMEPATHSDLWDNFLAFQPKLAEKVRLFCAPGGWLVDQLVWNLGYAAAMCRVHYYRRPEALPAGDDLSGLAAYAKRWYNTPAGKATANDYLDDYRRYVLELPR